MRALLRRLGVLPADPDALREAILRAGERDPQFAIEVAGELAAVTGTVPEPVHLPPAVFVDRAAVREQLAMPGIHVVAGVHGMGKTALALQVCRDAAATFPGGSVYVDLDAFRTGEALRVAEVHAVVLRQLDVPVDEQAPAELAEQYLRALLHRRCVLVFDNVAGAAELSALVQPWPASSVLVTTRLLTEDLWAWAPSPPVLLYGLDETGAWELLDNRCPGVLAAEPAAAGELLALCDRMPFAILQVGVHPTCCRRLRPTCCRRLRLICCRRLRPTCCRRPGRRSASGSGCPGPG
jgi:hypothetical protein